VGYGVNFINILRACFLYKILAPKLQSCVLGLKFFGAKISARKHAYMLMKLTPGVAKKAKFLEGSKTKVCELV